MALPRREALAVSPDPTLRYHRKGPDDGIRWRVRTVGAIYPTPAIGANGTAYVG